MVTQPAFTTAEQAAAKLHLPSGRAFIVSVSSGLFPLIRRIRIGRKFVYTTESVAAQVAYFLERAE